MGFFSNLFSGGDKNQNVKKLNSPESSSKSLLRKNSTSDDEYEILPADTSDTEKPARIGLTVLGIGFGGFLLWAAFAPLDEGVPAQATVTIETKRKPVQHLNGGIISKVYVKEGDFVKQNQPLIELDSATTQANFESVRQRYFNLRATEGRLVAEQNNDEKINFHDDLLKISKEDPVIAANVATQESLFNARRSSLKAELQSIDEAIKGNEAAAISYREMLESRRRQQKSLQQEISGVRTLVKDGYAPRNQLLQLERSSSESSAAISELLGNIERTTRTVLEMRQRKNYRENEYRKEVDGQLTEVRAQVQAEKEKYEAVKNDLERTIIRSPAEGQVVGLMAQAVGAVIGSGQKIMDIVPQNETLVLEAKIPPHLIDRVAVGERTDVRFNTFAHSPQLVVDGIVTSVSGDLLTDQPTGMTYYLARVNVTSEGMKILGDRQMLAGMPAEVVIITGERSMLVYLLRPLLKRMASSMKEE